MPSFALSSSTQTFSCSHENLATRLDTRDEYCVECSLELEGSMAEHALDLHEINRGEQESEPLLTNDITSDKGFSHQWTNRDGEYLEGAYNIADRPPSWLFIGKHVYPLFEDDELRAYLSLPSTDMICADCHLQINRFMGCLTCHIRYKNTKYLYWIA
jgi:hypothetical protein